MGCTSSIEQSTYQGDTLNKRKLSKQRSTSGIVYYRNPSIKENITMINQAKTSLDCQFIMQVLRKHYIFYQLNETSIKYIIKHMFYCLLKQHQPIYQLSKTPPTCLFIIDKGLIKIQSHGTYQAGSIICEDNLLLENNNQITALEDTYMWGLDKVQFHNVLQSISEQSFAANRAFLSQQYIFQYFSPNQLDGLAANVVQALYHPNQIMFSDEAYVIIKSGEASLFQGSQFQRNLTKRDTYGTLYQVHKRKSTKVRASMETQCLIITQSKLKYVLGFNIQQQIYQAIIRYVLAEIEMPGCEIEKILDQEQYKLKQYHNEKIKQRQIHEDLSILVEGFIDCEGEIMKVGEYVMDQFDNSEYIANGTVVVIARDYLYLEDYVVEDTNDQSVRYRPRFNELKHQQVLRRNQKNIISIVNFQQENFILRQINKQPQQKSQQDRKIKQHKKIFEEIRSPYIAQYYQFYEDNASYYFLFEFIDGTLLSEINLSISQTQKVIHQMICVVESCYKSSIISRSIKLDNFIYDGNIHLINFINAKQATRTYTLMDAPHYMAPEILEGKGYDCNSDVWSVGVCLYELLFDCVPFGQALDDPYQIYEEIMNSNVEFPEEYNDQDGRQIMIQLLNKNIYQRIGSNFDQLKNHKWFRNFTEDSPITYIQEVRY